MARQVYDVSIVTEAYLKIGDLGEYRLTELTRSRKRKYREAMTWLEQNEHLDAFDVSEEDEIKAIHHVGLAIEAATTHSDGLADKIVEAYKDDKLADASIGRALERVISWSEEQKVVGEA